MRAGLALVCNIADAFLELEKKKLVEAFRGVGSENEHFKAALESALPHTSIATMAGRQNGISHIHAVEAHILILRSEWPSPREDEEQAQNMPSFEEAKTQIRLNPSKLFEYGR